MSRPLSTLLPFSVHFNDPRHHEIASRGAVNIPFTAYSREDTLEWDVEGTDEFEAWYIGLSKADGDAVSRGILLLVTEGPALGAPHSSKVLSSRHSHMRELRVQSRGRPLRLLYAFDPRRSAIILLGGDKTGDNRWYEVNVPLADRLYDEYLEELRKEGLI